MFLPVFKKYLFILVTGIALLPAQISPLSARVDAVHPSLVFILTPDLGRCSGVVVDDDTVVTAAHCAEGGDTLGITFSNGLGAAGHVKHRGVGGTGVDIAVIRVDVPRGIPAVKLAQNDLAEGEACTMFGFGGVPELKTTTCHMHGKEITGVGYSFILEGLAIGGDSGGPVFNQAGELVAIIWGSDMISEVAVVPVSTVKRFLQGDLGWP